MKTVLYLDGRPLYLSDIKRNSSNKIMSGWVENGHWLLKLGTSIVYAFSLSVYDKSETLQNEWEYSTYEEVQVDVIGDYNAVIMAADKKRV